MVIPKHIREALGLNPGDHLVMATDGDRVILRKVTLADLLRESEANYRTGKMLSHDQTFEGLI